MQISSKLRAAAFFTSSATFPLCLCLSVSLVSDEFFPMSEMGAQPSRASCLPGTKTDRRNLCEPRRYERRLPISEYHDLTLSRFSRYVASRGGPGGAVRWAPSPARLSLPKSAQSAQSPVPARFGDTKPDRSPLFCRYLTVWPSLVGLARISREISAGTALAAQAGYRARRLDQLRPARTLWPSSLAVPGM